MDKSKKVKSKPKKLTFSQAKNSLNEYDLDFFKWTQHQVQLLKKGELEKLDVVNLIEEIDSLGRSDKRALRSQMVRLLMHLLKLHYQPDGQGNSNSWNSSILFSTQEIKYLIKDSPSLKNELIKMYPETYADARSNASVETKLPLKTFPKKSPWDLKEILPFIKNLKNAENSLH